MPPAASTPAKEGRHGIIDQNMDIVGWAIGLAGAFIGVIGIFVGVVLYVRGRRTKAPLWSIKTSNLIRNYKKKLPSLDISYKGKPAENVSISRILFWNGGPDAIRRQDIEDVPESTRLRIETVGKEVYILDVTIIETNCSANQLLASEPKDQRSSFISFAFLNRGQGGVFQVVHTGVADKDIRLTGEIVGAGVPHRTRIKVPRNPKARTIRQKLAALPLWVLSSGFFSVIILVALLINELATSGLNWRLLGLTLFLIIAYAISEFPPWSQRTPMGLRSFEDSI
jgi:hypothetical protein